MHKNKFINQIVNAIWFEQNLICMFRTKIKYNSMARFTKFTSNKKIKEKFEVALSKLVW